MNNIFLHTRLLGLLTVLLGLSSFLDAGVVSYFRFEQDNDPNPSRTVSPDEMGGPDFISNSARLDDSANPGSLPNTIVPQTGAPNTSSLDGLIDIDGSVAYNSALDLPSLTVELWARTEESTAVVISRSTTSTVISGINDGFRIYDPSDIKVQYYVTNGSTNTMVTIDTNQAFDNVGTRGDANTNWRHLAFSYEAATGTGTVYLDGVAVGSNDGPDNRDLYWGAGSPQPTVQVGVMMDGYNFSKNNTDDGFIDEIRFSSVALEEDDLLINPVPEPSTILGGIGLGFFAAFQIWRRRRNAKRLSPISPEAERI